MSERMFNQMGDLVGGYLPSLLSAIGILLIG